MSKLFIRENPRAPETGSLFYRFKDGEIGYIRFISKCEMNLIKEDGIITKEKRECKTRLLSS
ncbi:MAG: hypothetical protein ACXQTS_00580 [Candidatus Methanospirareceae archaeon]